MQRLNKQNLSMAGFLVCIFIFVTLSTNTAAFAEPAFNIPMSLTQPDGSVLECFASGDEFFHYFHDAQGRIV